MQDKDSEKNGDMSKLEMTDEDIKIGEYILSDKLHDRRYKEFDNIKSKMAKTSYTMEMIQEELIDLYLSVKIRKNDEIEQYDNDQLEKERDALMSENLTPGTLIEYIKSSIEILMALKFDSKEAEKEKECKKCQEREKNQNLNLVKLFQKVEKSVKSTGSSVKVNSSRKFENSETSKSVISIPEAPKEYEEQLRRYEADVRQHIQCEQQLQLHIEVTQEKFDNETKLLKNQQEKCKTYEENVELLMTTCKLLQTENGDLTELNEKHEAKISQ